MTNHPTGNQSTTQPTKVVGGQVANWLGGAFYVVVAAVALAGQTGAAVGWLHWPVVFALLAVAALELGGIALAARADFRRRLGERAVAARTLSAAVACFAVVFNWLGHTNHLAGGFFAGMSGLGYSVWLIQAGDRRRDQLRKDGKLPEVPPAYPLVQWLRHPLITWRARGLAAADPGLGLHASLTEATTAERAEHQRNAIAKVLHRRIRTSTDATAAEIAVAVFDLDEIAGRLEGAADYDGLTALVAADLDPGRLFATRPVDGATTVEADRDEPTTPTSQVAVRQPTTPTDRVGQSTADRPVDRSPRLRVVGADPTEPAAVANARHLRTLYPTGLPDSVRQIRNRTGWSKVRADRAVEAYRAGADVQTAANQNTDAEERSA